MFLMFDLFVFDVLEDEEGDDAAEGAGCEEKGVGGLLLVSLFGQVGDGRANAASLQPVDEEHETVQNEVGAVADYFGVLHLSLW